VYELAGPVAAQPKVLRKCGLRLTTPMAPRIARVCGLAELSIPVSYIANLFVICQSESYREVFQRPVLDEG